MNRFVRNSIKGILPLLFLTLVSSLSGQVFSPTDVNQVYNASRPPVEPEFGQPGKWVKTNRLPWNSSSFKCYIYKGVAFRLKFPKNYNPASGTKYPLFLFFHGKGERGSKYDNEFQLYHGGQHHMNAVDNNKFDGFLLYPQTSASDGVWGPTFRNYIAELIEDFLIPQVNVDPFRIIVDGLSNGGGSTWGFMKEHPTLCAAVLPVSSASSSFDQRVLDNKFTPIWLFQGALDLNPAPATARALYSIARRGGANFKYTEYANRGHESWNQAWNEADYFPYLVRANKANPWPLFGKTEFCPGLDINMTLGVSAGFTNYEWRKDGVLIDGANSNTYNVTSIGTYSCRILKGTTWSNWSPIPVNISYKSGVDIPWVQISGSGSRVLPSPDGKTTVNLETEDGFPSYTWQRVGSTATLSDVYILTGAEAGNSYRVQYQEQGNCYSAFSPAFTIVNANGANKPDAVTNLVAASLSFTAIKLTWSGNPSSLHPATNYEIYQATQPGGPYTFAGIVDNATFNFTKEGLKPGEKYYFVVRAVNNSAAAPLSSEASAKTQGDTEAPTTPTNLGITFSTRNSVTLTWDASSDNVGVDHYEIYVNGVKYYTTTETEYSVHSLQFGKNYTFNVKALDVANNSSNASNQVTGQALAKGLSYKHYLGSWTRLPDFKKLTPTSAGFVSNIDITNRAQDINYAYLWEGYIRFPLAGRYIIRTNSDDGSRVYMSSYDSTKTSLVNNDGAHGTQNADGTLNNIAKDSVSEISISYFQATSGQSMNLLWNTPGMAANQFVAIPDSVFIDKPLPLTGVAPAKPSNLAATATAYNRVNLTWTDNSNNERSFELFRSSDSLNGFSVIGVLPANVTSFVDSTVLPSTKYFYRIRSINQFGESTYDQEGYGISFSYHELAGMTSVPNFTGMIPKLSGRVANFDIGVRLRGDNFAMKFEGVITIAAAGTYTFYTNSDDGSKLFIDGVYVVDNDGAHSLRERSGNISLTAGKHIITVGYFEATGGETLQVSYSGPGLTKRFIPDNVLGEPLVNVLTPSAPPAPQAPSGLVAVPITNSSIRVNWTNNAPSATGLELYRSYNDNENYVLLTTLPATTTMFIDTALYPSSLFFYKIRAKGIATPSGYSNERSARTLGVLPVLLPIENAFMRHSSQLKIPVEATSGSATQITLSVSNLPAFATFETVANGKGVITFNPAESNQGTYTIIVAARNAQNDVSTKSFTLTVNTNYVPKINAVAAVSLNEKQTRQVNISAVDNDGADVLTWSLGSNTVPFVTIAGSNRNAVVSIAPGYSDAGVHKVLLVVSDGKNGKDTTSFNVTVADVPYTGPDDGTAPTSVQNVTATYVTDRVRLNWTNTAYNALRNEVYRAVSPSGPYTLLNPGDNNKDATIYGDSTAAGNRTYYYIVTAVNNNGSNSSLRVQITTPNKAPVITNTETMIAKSQTLTDMAIVATDDPGDVIDVSVSGLPPFAVFSSTGNGTGNLRLNPTSSHVGTYNFRIIATDNFGVTVTKDIKLSITDKYLTSTYINFTNDANLATFPWNNFSVNGTSVYSTTTKTGFKNETNTNTSISVRVNEGWTVGVNNPITGNNSGIFPDAVMKTGYQSGGTRTIRITGLSTSLKYNLVFYGNRASSPDMYYIVGDDTARLVITNNLTESTQITGLTPSASGWITVTIKTVTGSGSSAINALVIQSYQDQGIVFPPFNLEATSSTKNSIGFSWKSNERNLAGFEIWRSESVNGTYVKLPGTVAPNVFSYIDGSLPSGRTFYYKVKALIQGGAESELSEYVSNSTISYSININFNDGSSGPNQPVPWNNTSTLLYEGFTLPNLIDENNKSTGINLTIASNFSGYNVNGPSTGNNSGAVPDNVMKSYFYLVYGSTAKLRISGLNHTMKYNFIFFGSRTDNGAGQTTAYSIGEQTEVLNCKNNMYNTVSIREVRPDINGNADINIYSTIPGGNGYLNALTIQVAPDENIILPEGRKGGSLNTQLSEPLAFGSQVAEADDLENATMAISSYPNPFKDDVVLKLNLKTAKPKLVVFVRDFYGRTVYLQNLMNLPAGKSEHVLKINGRSLAPGVYGLQIVNPSSGESKSIKILK